MRFVRWTALLVGLSATFAFSAIAQDKGQDKKGSYSDPAKTDRDFAYQGEYVGELKRDEGDLKIGAQVIALGDGKFQLVGYEGGLPGDGWDQGEQRRFDGELKDGRISMTVEDNTVTISDGSMQVTDSGGTVRAELKKVERKSPTLGAKPPEGAAVLFDGKKADGWEKGRVTDDGLLIQGTTSKQKFGDCTAAHRVPIAVRAGQPRPGARQQRHLSPGTLRSADARLVRAGRQEQRVRRHLFDRLAQGQHVLPAARLADLRHRLHRREVRRRQENEERSHHRQAQRRDDPRQRRADARDDRVANQGRPGARADLSPGPRQPGALSQHLGGGEEVVHTRECRTSVVSIRMVRANFAGADQCNMLTVSENARPRK